MLHRYNPYIETFLTARECLAENQNISLYIKLVDIADYDSRRYNRPTANEIAVLMVGTGNEPTVGRDLVLHARSSHLQRIRETHSSYNPLRFPLLFPYGEQGWHINMFTDIQYLFRSIASYTDQCDRGRPSHKVTQREYYAFLLHHRQNQYNILHRSGLLFQEYIVDAYAQIEQCRLNYLRLNQEKLRSEVYQGIVDAAGDGRDLADIGNISILPSSFKGGPREMWQLYQDAMAIVRYCGKPDLFITVTCNSLWPEITSELFPGQTAQDRPDVVSKVFKLKLNQLMDDLTKGKFFGKTVAFIYVVEFQKRGLPHFHILIILDSKDKPHTPDEIDSMVCAEIPCQTTHPELYQTIMSFMLHGPCGTANSKAPCMQDGKCNKRFPKPFSDETIPEVDGYPIYRRRDNGITVNKNGHIFTNAHVVPYNAVLSARYNCHINVEIASSITAVKYLFKYVYKGHDRASITMVNHEGSDPIDEISEFLDSRYISAAECAWRIFGFRMHQHSPSVTRLQLHLPLMQTVQFNPQIETADDIIHRADIHRTTLNAFFEACKGQSELTRDLLYPDFPTKFTWDPKSKVWKPRKNNHMTIGRVTFCPPSAGERYYLRRLLYTVKGPTSFEALKKYNGQVYVILISNIFMLTESYIAHFKLHVPPEDFWKETTNGINALRRLV